MLSRPIKLAPNPLLMRIKLRVFEVPTKNPKKENKHSLGILSLYSLDYLSIKEGSLLCFVWFFSYEIHRTGMLQIAFLVSLESPHQEGCMGLVCKILQILLLRKVLCYGGMPERQKSKLKS